ncbi:MAG: FG-GAP-like repeat-containing protein, partial [Verrucomicrobiota bacterium]
MMKGMLRVLFCFWLAGAGMAGAFSVLNTNPDLGNVGVSRTAGITLQFDAAVDLTTAEAGIAIRGWQSGPHTGVFTSPAPDTVQFNLDGAFQYGERVEVTVSRQFESMAGVGADTHIFDFNVELGFCATQQLRQLGGVAVGFGAQDFEFGDFDGDGDMDLFIANGFDQHNEVLLNDGLGGFMIHGTNLGASETSSVQLGDIDGDGDLDAVVGNYNAMNTTYTNDGTGLFFPTGVQFDPGLTTALALGDLDGDGDLDVWSSNDAGQANRIWLNDGTGNFIGTGQALGGLVSTGVDLGDLDGDGDLDAIGVNLGQNSWTWFNNGAGTFVFNQILGNFNSIDVKFGDFDNDGDLDAFMINWQQPNRVFLNNGGGLFTDSGQNLGGNQQSWNIELFDADNDDDLDALVMNTGGGTNYIWENNGSAVFTRSDRTVGSVSDFLVASTDLNGDGLIDYFAADSFNQQRIYITDCRELAVDFTVPVNGTAGVARDFQPGILFSFKSPPLFGSLSTSIVFHGQMSGLYGGSFTQLTEVLMLYETDEDFLPGERIAITVRDDLESAVIPGDFSEPYQFEFIVGATGCVNHSFLESPQSMSTITSIRALELGDLDGDRDLDVVMARDNLDGTRVFLNDGDGNLTETGESFGNFACKAVKLADLDGDGDLDIFRSRTSDNEVQLNNGSGNFSITGQGGFGSSAYDDALLADFDRDGDIDAFLIYQASQELWLNDGNGIFSTNTQGMLNFAIAYSGDYGDVDDDGDFDVLIAADSPGGGGLWLNDGAGFFVDSGVNFTGVQAEAVRLADLDGDMDLDIVFAERTGGNSIWTNAGDRLSFGLAQQLAAGSTGTYVEVIDIDGDSDLDVLATYDQIEAKAWLNDGSANFS